MAMPRMTITALPADMARRPGRLILAAVAALIIALAAFLQSASSALTSKNPALAVQLFPLNGLAIEQLASRDLMDGVEKESDIIPSAKGAAGAAKDAFAREALTPKAMAIVAFGKDAADKRALLGSATRLNRRDLLLQGLVLEGRAQRQDYEGTLETLNTILRVHPEQQASFFPVLKQAFADESALQALAGILDQNEGWHDDFLTVASQDPAVIPNLAKLRLSRSDVNADVDRRLISGLVAAGEVERAREIYLSASGAASGNRAEPALDWTSEFPPFDWKLADEAGFRAQLGGSANELELFVRGGKGGTIAEKLIGAPSGPFAIRVGHALGPAAQVKDVRLQLQCPGAEKPFYDEPFRVRQHDFRIANVPTGCSTLAILIHARAWTGRSSIRGTLDELEIIRN